MRKTPSLYIFAVESLFDLTTVPGEQFSGDPFYQSFRENLLLAQQQGHMTSMIVGTRGGGSATTEFEILCGLPSTLISNTSGAEFSYLMNHKMNCLPKILSDKGYKTAAFYPSKVQYFNEQKGYEFSGFQESFLLPDMISDDLDGTNLSDASLFRQMHEWRKKTPLSTPVFMYAMTTASHFPHTCSSKRPQVLQSQSIGSNAQLANRFYYTTKEFMEFVTEIERQEPDAIIVALGDHRPFGYEKFRSITDHESVLSVHRTVYFHNHNLHEDPPAPLPYLLPGLILKNLSLPLPDEMKFFTNQSNSFIRPMSGLPIGFIDHDGHLSMPHDATTDEVHRLITIDKNEVAHALYCED